MSSCQRHVLPRLLHLAMRQETLLPDRAPRRGVGAMLLGSVGCRLLCQGHQAHDMLIVARGGQGLKRHVAALHGPLVVLLKQERADETGDRGLVGKDADKLTATLRAKLSTKH